MRNRKDERDLEERKAEKAAQDKDIHEALNRIKNKVLVMSGKGGVGKSSIAAYLAVALAKKGFRVGLMDVDLHGPSIPRILGLSDRLYVGVRPNKATPIKYRHNLEVVSIESLLGDKDAAMIWRGPLKGGVIRQFISDIEWHDLDFMIIDSPPGTGDEPLTVAQTIPDAKALIVTTPQEISLADVRKSISFCRKVKMEIMGLVENMSGLTCPFCGEIIDIFKRRGGIITAEREKLNLLATLPFDPEVVQKGDSGDMGLLDNAHSKITQAVYQMAEKIVAMCRRDKDITTVPRDVHATG
jgi:Mrp family chromosome partitioning ATPase